MSQNHWLIKQEPEAYPWSQLVRDRRTAWTGIRNFQARNHLRNMKVGDRAVYYHSVSEKQVVGVARVVREAYPDPTASEGDWSCVDIAPEAALQIPVTLSALKSDPSTAGLPLIRQSRLSVMPMTPDQFNRIVELGGGMIALD